MRSFVLALAALCTFAACSSSDDSDDASETTAATSAAPTTVAADASTAESAAPETEPASTEPASTAPDTSASATTEPETSAPETSASASTEPGTTDVDTTAASTTGPSADGPLTVQELLDLGRPIVLAHAGGEDQHPHSTPYAFAESVDAGVDMLDFDVQLTADGVLVVHHDDDTVRMTNADLDVANTDYADLAELDNAYWFTAECTCTGKPDEAYVLRGVRTGDVAPPSGYTPEDFIIPKFEDMVRRFPNMPVNVEIKGSGEQAIAAAYELARILTDEGRLDSAVVTSFDDLVVDAFHELARDVEITPGLGVSSAFILDGTPLPEGMRILQLPPEFSGIHVLSPENIAKSHAAGYVIWVWPNNRDYENLLAYTGFLQLGLDGLNVNFPALGVQAVRDFTG